jgi:hypothetical protein
MKKEKNPSKKAFDAAAFAQFLFGPSGWQAETVFLVFRIPRDDSDGTKHGMNPGNETQTPIGCIQADDMGTDLIESHCPGEQALCKRCIMSIGRWEEKEDGESRTSTDEGMHPEASQEGTWMVSGSMTESGIGITASPSQDGRTVNDEITSPNESRADGMENRKHKERLIERGPCCMTAFALLGFAGNARLPLFVQRQATNQSQSGPTLQPVMHILVR